VHHYRSTGERLDAIARGETTHRDSTVSDGRAHYAIARYADDGERTIAHNLTGSPYDDRAAAERIAGIRNLREQNDGGAGSHSAERIA
jgi:hypothetical protein